MNKAPVAENTLKPRSRRRIYSLGVAGILCGLVGFYVVEGWASVVLFGIGGLCFAAGRYLSYMEDAGPD